MRIFPGNQQYDMRIFPGNQQYTMSIFHIKILVVGGRELNSVYLEPTIGEDILKYSK